MGFYNVLIADDEVWIRRWLNKTIPELNPEFRIAAVAEGGEAALRALGGQQIDIVVSDIHMPVVTGLELAKRARNGGHGPQFILVSGYDDFSYAKKAIELNVIEYLLKPVDKEELARALQKAVEAIQKEQRLDTNTEIFHSAIQNHLQNYLLDPAPVKWEDLLHTIEAAGKHYHSCYAGVFQCDVSLENKTAPPDVVTALITRVFPGSDCYIVLEDCMNYTFFVLQEQGAPPPYLGILKRAVSKISPWCRLELSDQYENLAELPGAVAQARNRLIESYVIEKSPAMVDTGRDPLLTRRADSLLAIKSHNRADLRSNAHLLQQMLWGRNSHFDDCRYVLFSLISEIIRLLAEADGSYASPFVNRDYEFCVKINHYHNVPAMIDWFLHYSEGVLDYLEKNQSFDVAHIATRVSNYLLEHYAEDLSLSSVCGQFGINPSYFSKKFKEKIGMNFVDMLTRIRLDAASHLLADTELSIADISRSVGIKNAKYFSKICQNSYGVNPTQYREKRRHRKRVIT